jgi:hypothetical protein
MPIEGLSAITREIEEVIERNLRIEMLKARAAQLEQELADIRSQLAGTGRKTARRAVAKPCRARATARPSPKTPRAPETRRVEADKVGGVKFRRRAGFKSVRTMVIETMSRHRKPMKVKRLFQILTLKGWKTTRKAPTKTVDAVLRNNPTIFRKTAPSTFELIPH